MLTETPALALGVRTLWQQPGPGPTNRWKGRRGVSLASLTALQLSLRALTHPGEFRLSDSPQAGYLGRYVHTDLWVASHLAQVNAQEVAEPMRHEHGSQVGLDHGIDAATQGADAGQLLQVDAVSQAVHVRPPNACGSEGGCSKLWRLAARPGLPRARFGGHKALTG